MKLSPGCSNSIPALLYSPNYFHCEIVSCSEWILEAETQIMESNSSMGDFNLRCALDQSDSSTDIVQSEPALHPHEGCCQVSTQNLGIEWSCNLKICPRSLQRKHLSWQLQSYLTADLSASEGKQGCCWGLNWSSVSHGNAVLSKPPLQGFLFF